MHIVIFIISLQFGPILKIIDVFQAEVDRREKEVKKLNDLLEDTRRKNLQVQEKIAEQMEILKRKLEEYKLEHKKHEDSIEEDILSKEDLLFNVKDSLERRKKGLDIMDEDFEKQKEALDSYR